MLLPSSIIFALLLIIAYILLFPKRVGDTSRISFVDRIILGFRLFLARVELTVVPFRQTPPIKKINFTAKSLFFDSADDALRNVLLARHKKEDDTTTENINNTFYFSGFAATESPFLWSKALEELLLAKETDDVHCSSALKNITVISQTGSSLRGVGNVSLDQLIANSPPGTITRFISGHLETCRLTLQQVKKEQDSRKKETANKTDENDLHSNMLRIINLPLGVISRLVGLQATETSDTLDDLFGPSISTTVGLGTFLEEEAAAAKSDDNLSFCCCSLNESKTLLTYKIPKITVAFIHAKKADRAGNIYFDENTVIGDAIDCALAAKKNKGKVFVSVERIVDDEMERGEEKNDVSFILKSDFIDAIVLVKSVLQRDMSGLGQYCQLSKTTNTDNNTNKEKISLDTICEYWERASLAWGLATTFHSRRRNTDRHCPMITHCHDEILRLSKMMVMNQERKKRQQAVLQGSPSSSVEIEEDIDVIRIIVGVSAPEMVAMRLAESKHVFLGHDVDLKTKYSTTTTTRNDNDGKNLILPPIQFLIESGVIGGLPAPGFLFGNSFHPHKISRSPEFWNAINNINRNNNNNGNSKHFAQMCVLGAGEVDVYGNVNVSLASSSSSCSSSEKNNNNRDIENIIGCGGFPDICDGVSFAIVFVCSILSSGTRFHRPHGSSIVQQVSQITFNPLRALLEKNCEVRYCTEFGVFKAALWKDHDDKVVKTRLVAPPGLELLIQEKCKVKLIL